MKASSDLIFVVGNSRSGTTLMGRILGRNDAVHTCRHEIHYWGQICNPSSDELLSREQAIEHLSKLLRTQKDGYFSKKAIEIYTDEAQNILDRFQTETIKPEHVYSNFLRYTAESNEKKIVCDQTPRNLFYIAELRKYYKNCSIVNMQRDPRAVLFSQKKKWKRRFLGGAKNIPLSESLRAWVNYHPITISKLWNASIASAQKQDENIFSVKYENLVENPSGTIKQLCNNLKIEFNPSMLDVPVVGSSDSKDSTSKIGIARSSTEKWNSGINKAELYICQRICRDNMSRLGYQIEEVRMPLLGIIGYGILFPFHIALALALNLSKSKNIIDTIKRRIRG